MPSAKAAASSAVVSKPASSVASSSKPTGSAVSHSSSKSVTTATRKPLKVRERPKAVLRFSPKAWMKILWFRGRGSSEIAGFGISFKEDPLYVVDFYTVRQEASVAYFEMDDEDANRFLSDCVKNGLHPSEVMRIFLHTHPGNSCTPSQTDENCFARVFGDADWSIMCIVAKDDTAYARAQFTAGPGGSIELKKEVDWSPPFEGISQEDYESWEDEYCRNIKTTSYSTTQRAGFKGYTGPGSSAYGHDYYANQHGGQGDHEVGRTGRDWDREAWGGCARGATGFEEEKKDDGKAGFGDEPKTETETEADSTQRELPERGHPFPASDDPTRMGMLSDTEEKVWLILADSHRKTVYTDASFYVYPLDATLLVVAGDVVETLYDVCLSRPTIRGEVQWHENKTKGDEDTWTPIRKTLLSSSGGFVDITSRAGTARNKDGLPAAVKEPTKVADTSNGNKKSDDTPGFSEEPDPNKTALHAAVKVSGDDEHVLAEIAEVIEDLVSINDIENVLEELAEAQQLLRDSESAVAIAEYQGATIDEVEASKIWGEAHDRVGELEDEYDELVTRFNDAHPEDPILPEEERVAAFRKNLDEREAKAYAGTEKRADDVDAVEAGEATKEIVHEALKLVDEETTKPVDESQQQGGFADDDADVKKTAQDETSEGQGAENSSMPDETETIFGNAGP